MQNKKRIIKTKNKTDIKIREIMIEIDLVFQLIENQLHEFRRRVHINRQYTANFRMISVK